MSISSAIPFARLVSVTHAAGRCATLLATVTLLAGPAMASLIVPPAQTSFGLGGGCTSTGKTIIVTGLDSDTCESVRGDPVQMQTFLNGNAPTAQTTVTAASFNVFGSTTLDYFVGVEGTATPPFVPAAIPVSFRVVIGADGDSLHGVDLSLAASVSNWSNVVGSVEIDHPFDDPAPTSSHFSAATSGTLQFEISEGNAIAEMSLTANCGVGVLDALTPGNGEVTCSADPLVGFDQAAFDAQYGTRSFNLAQYFDFVFSEGLAPPTPAPEPPSFVLLLSGGLAAFWFRRVRIKRRRASFS